jgi:integrase/recombinase XerC
MIEHHLHRTLTLLDWVMVGHDQHPSHRRKRHQTRNGLPISRPPATAAGSSELTGEQLAANPMQLVGRPKLGRPLPKALPRTAVEALLETVAQDRNSKRQTDWAERDLALILTALLAGLRADELRQADIGDIRTTDDGAAVIHVKGKGGKERSVPIEAEMLSVLETYLVSRASRFPGATKPKSGGASNGLSRWLARSPLFVGRDGERITRGTLQSRIKRVFKRAGPAAQPVPGALVHGLRHTYATELANSDVSVVAAAGTETRSAAALNPLYTVIPGAKGMPVDES